MLVYVEGLLSMVKDSWRVWQDGGHGITSKSLRYFDSLKGKLGRIDDVHIDKRRTMSMEITCERGVVLLSGCNCGYGGEGPHGSIEILKKMGVEETLTTRVITSSLSMSMKDIWIEMHLNGNEVPMNW